ncbi:hypothetical protein [Photobacterium indicum]|uniref:hypothetical protein n=1 Tax=Photobacterium indicum TaxID=81447 RepID=UPI003D13FE24
MTTQTPNRAYRSSSFIPQRPPEQNQGWQSLMTKLGTAKQLTFSLANDHRPISLLGRVKPSLLAQEDLDIENDVISHKHMAIKGGGIKRRLIIVFASLCKVGTLYAAPLAIVLGFSICFFADVPLEKFYPSLTVVITLAVIASLFWLPLELMVKYGQSAWVDRLLSVQKEFELSRETGMVTVFDNKNRVAYAHPFIEFDCVLSSSPTPQGFLRYQLQLIHRYNKYSRTAVIGNFIGDNEPVDEYGRLWNYIQAFMDNDKPLPDLPVFELYRHLDTTSVAYDEKVGRKPDYWRSMSDEAFETTVDDIQKKQNNKAYTGMKLNIFAPNK